MDENAGNDTIELAVQSKVMVMVNTEESTSLFEIVKDVEAMADEVETVT